MALFGTQRDVSLFRHMSRESMGDIITEQCAFYKYKLEIDIINNCINFSKNMHVKSKVYLNFKFMQ